MLQVLSRHHDLWLSYVLSFGVNPDTAKDIVQEFYLKMHDYNKDIMTNDDVNFYFVYLVLRNMVFDLKRKEKKFYFTEQIPAIEDEEYIETDTSKSKYITKWINDNTIDKIEYNSIDDLEDIYHAYIFNEIILNKKSIKQLERETTITYHSLRNTVQIIKKEIKKNYETWYNTRKDI